MVSLVELLQLANGGELRVVADNAKSHAPPGSLFGTSPPEGRGHSESCRWNPLSAGSGYSPEKQNDSPLCPPPRPPQSPRKSSSNDRRYQPISSDAPISLPKRQDSIGKEGRDELLATLSQIVDNGFIFEDSENEEEDEQVYLPEDCFPILSMK